METEYIYVDSRTRDTSLYPNANTYTVFLANPLKNIRQIDLVSATVPNSMFNFSTTGTFLSVGATTVPLYAGFYSGSTLAAELNSSSQMTGVSVVFNTADGKFLFSSASTFSISTTSAQAAQLLGFAVNTTYSSGLASADPVYKYNSAYTGKSVLKSAFVCDFTANEMVFLDIEELRTHKMNLSSKLVPYTSNVNNITSNVYMPVNTLASHSFGVIPMDVVSGSIKTFKETTDYVMSIRYPRVIEKLSELTVDWRDINGNLLNFNGANKRTERAGLGAIAAHRDLRGIDRQKKIVEQNTRQFVEGHPANNVLLTGARGTGKSSLIKACLNEYAPQGLRLIEVDKDDLVDLPDLIDVVASRPEKFIVFCDDLSFEDGEPGYKALKSILDGSVAAATPNVLIYATSNRRHLLPEYMKDNLSYTHTDDGEVHPGEVVEEKISLSERFGLWVSFYPFSQDEYLTIVAQWLLALGAPANAPEQARAEALVKFFTRDEHATRRGLPQVLLACHPSHKGHTLRPRETLLPLAHHLKLEVQTPFESKDYAQLAHALLHDPAYRGKAVVVCWVHDSMPAFAAALGVTPEPPKWKDSDYDSAYVITLPEGRAHLKTIAQHLR